MSKIGFIGLGIMGRPMAKNLMKAGCELVVNDVVEAAVAEMVEAGAQAAASVAELAAQCDIIITMLPNSPFVKKMQKIDFTFQTEASAEFSYKLKGQSAKATIAYRPVNISIDDSNPGATQTAWIASTTNAQNNTHRNVMLKLITPLSYSLGNLVYELVSITRA